MKKEYILIIIIFFIGFLLRVLFLSHIPPELNRDEVSVGYNAYSLLKTGKDEHGQGPWPLVFKAFGDYKIPGYIYLILPLVKIFGLNAFSVRLPAALFGSLTILVIYLLVKELFPKKEKFALLSALLLTISPFHLQYSRQQFEATVALFFSLTGICFLLKARKKICLLFVSLPFLIISFFIYNTPLILVPLLVLWTLFVFRNNFFVNRNSFLKIIMYIVILFTLLITYWCLVKEGNQGRANTTIFNQIKIKEQIDINIHYLGNKNFPLWVARLFNNKPIYWLGEYSKNYLAAFNPKFIFITSDNNPWHSLGYLNFGNLLIIFLPFLIYGLVMFSRNLAIKEYRWLVGYFLIAPLANGLTIDSPILTRLLDFHIVLVIISAIGLESVLRRCWQTKKVQIISFLIIGLIIITVTNYFITYFVIFPQFVSKDDFWLSGIKEVCQTIKKEESKYDFVFLDSKTEVGYIFLAFYLPFNPSDFQSQAVWKFDGFEKVKFYQKYIFDKDANKLNKIDEIKTETGSGKKILLIEKLPFQSHPQKLDYRTFIYNSLGEPIWQFTSMTT